MVALSGEEREEERMAVAEKYQEQGQGKVEEEGGSGRLISGAK